MYGQICVILRKKMYIFVCVCVCVCVLSQLKALPIGDPNKEIYVIDSNYTCYQRGGGE
jgi:hypothetical protein